MTSKYTFDPHLGFALSNSSTIPPDFSSLTCYLTFRSKTESLQFMVHSQQLVANRSATIPVTLQTGEEVVEGWGDVVIDCKVEVDNGEVEVEWEVPALPFHRLLFLFFLFIVVFFVVVCFCYFTTGSILVRRLSGSPRDLTSRR